MSEQQQKLDFQYRTQSIGISNPFQLPSIRYKKLLDKRVPKVATVDVETAPYYLPCEPRFMSTKEEPCAINVVGGVINDETVKIRIDKNKNTKFEYYTDTVQTQIIFDIGWVVHDRNSNQFIHRSFVIEEVFLNMERMKHAHYFKKYPQYVKELASGQRTLIKWLDVVAILEQDIIDYGIRELAAYNAKFDFVGAIPATHKLITGRDYTTFDEWSIQLTCLWNWAANSIMKTENYIQTALDNDWVSDKGNVRTNAETLHRYLTGEYEFIEEHTGLEDAIIEADIYIYLWNAFKRANRNLPTGTLPWAIVNNERTEKGYTKKGKEEIEECE